jgi:hypothetical protein
MGRVHGLGENVIPVDALIDGFFLVIAVATSKQQHPVRAILFGIKHIIAMHNYRYVPERISLIPFRTKFDHGHLHSGDARQGSRCALDRSVILHHNTTLRMPERATYGLQTLFY